jgi:ATP-binding cassette subfamily B protein
MRKIRQRDETDCAAACLAAIAHHYRLELSVSAIRLLAGTGTAGTSVLGVVHAAESLGFSAKGVKGASEHLADVPLPCVAHVVPSPGYLHFVVVTKVTRRKVIVMDPAEGAIKRLPRKKFEEIWSGIRAVKFVSPRKPNGWSTNRGRFRLHSSRPCFRGNSR